MPYVIQRKVGNQKPQWITHFSQQEGDRSLFGANGVVNALARFTEVQMYAKEWESREEAVKVLKELTSGPETQGTRGWGLKLRQFSLR